MESSWLIPSAAEEQLPFHSSNDVFHEPVDSMDCQAVSCPIHQRYGGFSMENTPRASKKKKKLVACVSHENDKEEVSCRNFWVQLDE